MLAHSNNSETGEVLLSQILFFMDGKVFCTHSFANFLFFIASVHEFISKGCSEFPDGMELHVRPISYLLQ